MTAAGRLLRALGELPPAQLYGALPLVALMLRETYGAHVLPPDLVKVIDVFTASLGLPATATEEDARAALQAYRAAHGLTPAVWRSLLLAMEASSPDDVNAALLGIAKSSGVLQRTAPPPSGTAAGGPLARAMLADMLPKKS
jgi:hypothetical protein